MDRSNGTFLGGSDPFLQLAHFGCQRRLVTYRGRHPSKQGRYLGTRLRKPEDVVDEEQYVAAFLVAEIFSHREARQGYAQTRTRRLVHLSEYHRGFLDNAGFRHFHVEVITFTGTFPYAGKYGNPAVFVRDVTDQFLDRYGLTYAGAAEQADFTALRIRSQQVDDLDPGFQHFRLRRQFIELRRFAVNRIFQFGSGCAFLVDRFAEHVKHAAERCFSDRNRNRRSQVDRFRTAHKAVRRGHGDTTNEVVAQMIGSFQNQRRLAVLLLNFYSVEDFRQLTALKFDVNNRTHYADNASFVHLRFPPKIASGSISLGLRLLRQRSP
ncbi:hypothetical protein D3C81_1295300 [compost metagenome]